MMISETMAARLNQQIKEEFFSYWLYTSMSYAYEAMGLKGFAKWFQMQADEEKGHAVKIAGYLVDQGARVKLTALPQPKTDYASVVEIVQETLDHEKQITKMIHELVALANKENDFATANFLAWFVDEQVEEVSTSQRLLDMVTLAGENKIQLYIIEGRIFQLRE
jgi:ferritin